MILTAISTNQLLMIHAVASIWMTSLIWVIQLVHYPFFQYVDQNKQRLAANFHTSRIFWCVFPAMIIEVITLILYIIQKNQINEIEITITTLLITIWASTILIQVPQHQAMATQYNQSIIKQLVKKNWIRTICWTLKTIFTIYLIMTT